ncbi:hypothetical protein [Aquiflexum sp.]|uniref:hypothetical protein n=1 Tax=Aquiflexum sp. TaxID=1872584 RepID=UPI003593DD7E
MKKLMIITLSILMMSACSTEKSVEERYIYEGEKIVDIETGDEYLMEEEGKITVVHTDGSKEKLAIDETPFYETALSEEFIQSLESNYAERKQVLLEEKRTLLKENRRSRYAEISDEELLKQFQQAHKDGLDMGRQMDMVAELIERGAVTSDQAPELLEIEPELINFDIDIEKPGEKGN